MGAGHVGPGTGQPLVASPSLGRSPEGLRPRRQPRVPSSYIVLGIAAVLYLGPLLLDAPLTDPDEGRHAVISQEMIERGDLVVPRLFGQPFLDKPILFFWAQAASIRVLGAHTAAAR